MHRPDIQGPGLGLLICEPPLHQPYLVRNCIFKVRVHMSLHSKTTPLEMSSNKGVPPLP